MRPILFTLPIFDLPVYSYGVALGLACVIGAHLAVYLAERSSIEGRKAWWFALTVIVLGVVAGRLHELIVQGQVFSDAALSVRHSGRTAYGGYIGGTIAAIVAARVLKVSFWRMADAIAPTLALGLGIVRLGCFCYGCDYGFRSEEWGVVFPAGSPAWIDQIHAGDIPNPETLLPGAAQPTALPVFPVQLPASFLGFLLFGILLKLWFHRPRRAGTVFLSFGLLYGIVRAGLEQLREDSGRGTLLGLSTSTTIGLFTAAICAALLWIPLCKAWRPDAGEIVDPPHDDEPDSKSVKADSKPDPEPRPSGSAKPETETS